LKGAESGIEKILHLKEQCHEIFDFRFFHESVSPKPLRIPLGPFFEFSRKFAEIFAAQGSPPVLLTPVANGKYLQSEKFSLFFRDFSKKFEMTFMLFSGLEGR
jgi:hypothetical protein